MKKDFCKSQKGSVAVLAAILLPVLLAFAGLALDIGNLVLSKTHLRNAVDAAALAAALTLTSPGQASGTSGAMVTTYLTDNGVSGVTPTITYTQDTVKNSSNYPEIKVSVSKSIPTYLMRIFGFNTINLTVAAEAVNVGGLQPPFNFTLFSKNTLSLNGSSTITGSVGSNAQVDMNGSQVITGNVVGVTGISMNGSERIDGYAQATTVGEISTNGSEYIGGGKEGGAVASSFPDFSQEIINATESADKHNGNYTFNGSGVSGQSIYVNGNVTINGSVDWSGSILATGTITINGSSQITGSNQILLYSTSSSSSAILMNGSESLGTATANCIAYAPNGTITINGSSTWYGRVVGDTLTLNGSGGFNGSNVTSMPFAAAHARLIS